MSNTITMECQCCGFDTDCIDGLCEACNSFNSINQKQVRAAYEAGLKAYAWWKDGVQYVGTCGTTLAEALKETNINI